MKKIKNPDQPLIIDKNGCVRFKRNKIVDKMLDFCTQHDYSLNEISRDFKCGLGEKDNDDYTQLMQLVGYSIGGYGELSTSPPKKVNKFDKKADKLIKKQSKS